MEETYLLNVEGVKKKILHGGYGGLPDFKDGSKVTFHFQTLKDNFERTVIDDSRQAGIPMEIIVGKMFKIEVWETLLTSMRIGEVAEFWCDAVHTGMYALISKGMRKIAEGKDPLEGQKHRCGMGNMFDYHSTGYADLDELQRTPQPLIFIMELFKVEDPTSYKRDTWAMNNDEKLLAVPKLHTEGNRLVLSRKFKEAAEKYQEAVICLRNVQAKEKPWDEDWLKLENLITPLVLNYCQCQLELGEYYEVLEHTTDLLQKNNKNVKAYFKRAKAHAAVWNEKEARADFLRVAHLDPSLAAAVRKELKILGEKMRQKHVEDRKRYQGLFQHPSQGEREETMTEESEELFGKNELPGYGHKVEMGENNKEAFLKPKSEGQGAEICARNQETGEANKEEEKKGSSVKREEKETDDKEMKIEIGMKKTEEQGEGKVQSYLKEDLTDGETPEIKQLGSGHCQPSEEGENAEMEGDQAGQTEDFAALNGDQESRAACGICKKNVGRTAGIATDSIVVEGHCEAEMGPEAVGSTRGMENCDVMRGRGEIKVRANFKTQDKKDLEEEDNKEGARGESPEESSEGDNFFQFQEEEPKREAGVFIEPNLREEASCDKENCGGPKKVHSVAENDEHRESTELEKTEREAGSHPESEEEICGYEASPGQCEANTEDNVIIGGDGGKRALEDSTNTKAGDSKEETNGHDKVGGGGKKEAKVGSSSVSQRHTQDGQECFVAEMNVKAENLKVRVMEENSVTEQAAALQVTWEGPEKVKGEMEMHLGEESFHGNDNMLPVSREGKNEHQA